MNGHRDAFLLFQVFNSDATRRQVVTLNLPFGVGFWRPASSSINEKPHFRWTWGHRWREL